MTSVSALSAGMAEALAGLCALDWVLSNEFPEVSIQPDCEEFVKGVHNSNGANPSLQPILLYFCSLCSKCM